MRAAVGKSKSISIRRLLTLERSKKAYPRSFVGTTASRLPPVSQCHSPHRCPGRRTPSVPQYQRVSPRHLSSVATTDDFNEESGDHDHSNNTKIVPFLLADIGEGIAEVELLQWFVSPGDTVSQFDRVCEVQSDKATVEITSRFDGIVESVDGAVGDMISVGCPLLHIAVADDGGGGGAVASAEEAASGGAGASSSSLVTVAPTLNNIDDEEDKLHIPPVASTFPDFQARDEESSAKRRASPKVLATPAVRKIGMENNIDLSTIMGTGRDGRVLKADIIKLLKSREPPTAALMDSASRAVGDGASPLSPRGDSKSASSQHVTVVPGEDTVVPIRGYNRLMVKSMTESLAVPHMCYADEVNMNELKACRAGLKPLAESYGVKLSYLPFLIKAASLALGQYPVLNSSINVEDYTLTYHGDHNIGVAMDTPRGLAVPVVRHCQKLSVLDIARELSRLQSLATEGNLTEQDITGTTFTLSNIGAIGGTYMSPIVSPPQVAIGAVGKIQRLPRFVGETDEVESAHIMQISWGGDHRVIDGATMARFSNLWKNYLEQPMSMTFSMK